MNFLNDAFYWISLGLLVPVMVALLLGFIYALALVGGFYAHYRDRRHYRANLEKLKTRAATEGLRRFPFADYLAGHPRLLAALHDAQTHDWRDPHTSKAIADFEIAGEKALEPSKLLVRLGPMLGLLGTLIPMGPALVGLATGDIASMATNMQVAFSTTVLGVVMGGIGFIIQMVRKRWFSEDLHQLQFFVELAENERA
jgi:biopolymer transport protein ExbB/TolQ